MKNKNLFGECEEMMEEAKETKPKGRIFGFSPFALQDAIGEKNVKKMWLEYEKLRFSGIEAEDLVYKIISKVRDMVAISMGAGKEDLGILKDYPYDKSKRDIKNWQGEDLKKFYTKLVGIYHYSRMGGDELDIAIEKTLLGVF
ncbi:MAG: hypothetical protein V1896_02790 [Candidatus Zambryskibacteria bacterium]